MSTRTKDLYHEQNHEELLMSLMNQGWTREYAERQIARQTELAHLQAENLIEQYFPEELPN